MPQHLNKQPSKPRRVVILGSGGFIGRKLSEKLAASGIEVQGVRSSDINLCSADSAVALRAIFRPDDVVVFAAAITPDKGKDVRTFMRNLQMAENVATALEGIALSHMIYISSDAVFADDLPPITESTPADPPTIYGLMHLAREKILASVLEKTKTPSLVLRPCTIYGPGDTHDSYGPNRFLRSALGERKIKLFGQGEEKRPQLYIHDLIAILLEALLRRTTGLLNVAPGESASFGSIAQQIIRLVNNGTSVESMTRSGPVTHRHFAPSNLLRAFPRISFTPLETALHQFLRELT